MADETKKAFFELAEKIAAALGDGWGSRGLVREYYEGQPDEYDNPIIAHPSGREIWLSMGWGAKGKLHVQGTWPSYSNSDNKASDGSPIKQRVTPRELRYENGREVYSPSINVSVERGADAIAKDIQRRFLPEYERVWDLCKEQCVRNEDYDTRSNTVWMLVCKALGDDKAQNRSFSMRVADTYVEFEKSGTAVRVRAYGLPAHIAIDLINFFKERGGR